MSKVRLPFFDSFNIDIIYMTFRKLTEQDKIKLEEFKQKHGSTNLGSYRALLMRGTDPNQAIDIINKRSNIQPIAEVPAKTQPKRRVKKEIFEPDPEPVPMAIEDVKAPAPKPKPKKEKIKKEQFEKKKSNHDNSLDIVI